jgi:hypothetical protein
MMLTEAACDTATTALRASSSSRKRRDTMCGKSRNRSPNRAAFYFVSVCDHLAWLSELTKYALLITSNISLLENILENKTARPWTRSCRLLY